MLVYFLLRALPPERPDLAASVTRELIAFQQALGLFVEPGWQSAALEHRFTRDLADALYTYLHFPVLALAGVLAWFHSRATFERTRDTLFISMVLGLVFYFLLPAAPPRLMAELGYDYGFVDTIFGGGARFEYAQPGFYVNDYAAVPSFHVGWIVLSSVAMWVSLRNPVAKLLAIVPSIAVAWASAATANHLLVDMVIGVAVVWVAYLAARRWPLADVTAAARGAWRTRRTTP
ncbi:MAG: phosphatase PAP2 family protein [Dehalococcoidia bacterium]